MTSWPEIMTAKAENRHEIKLAGPVISKKIADEGLDTSVFQLTNINLLNISDTCLSTISDDIKLLTNLQTLLLYGNRIATFNENITSLPKLKVLDLSRNEIKTIPESLNKMKELTNINLSSNEIEEFPKLLEFPNLISLDLSNNKLSEFLDVGNASLPHLTDLKLKGNAIDSISSNIAKGVPSLKNFDIGDNKLKVVPGELALLTKLKELNLKGNKLTDKRFLKLVDQCRTKQVLDYIRDHCPKEDNQTTTAGKKGKKGQKKQEEAVEQDAEELCHLLKILHVEDDIISIKYHESQLAGIRPFILCCIVKDLNMDDGLFKKFIQLQTRLHDTVCEKRNVATIATHDLAKIPPGNLTYTSQFPKELKLIPLSRNKSFSGEQLFQQLVSEADALRKEKKRNVYTGIHKYLYLLEGKPKYPCLQDSAGNVISFPPITNSETTKMSADTKEMLLEVTSHSSLGACRTVMDATLQQFLLLGIGGSDNRDYHTLTVQQVKIVDPEGTLKSVYPSRADCNYEATNNIKVFRVAKTNKQ